MHYKSIKYKPPKDSKGNVLWVPIVVKNKDYLIGFLDSMHIASTLYDIPGTELVASLSSDRLNDVLPDGRRIGKISKKEFKTYIKGMMDKTKELSVLSQNNADFSPKILNDYFLTIDCSCGNFYAFSSVAELPEDSFDCGICKKRLIDYTERDDEEYEFDGDPGDVEGIVTEITDEMDDDE